MPAAVPLAIAGASVAGSMIASKGAQSAANTQAKSAQDASQAQLMAAQDSIAAQQQGQEAAQANQQPWINAGSAALGQLGNLLGIKIQGSGQFADQATQYGGNGGGTGGGSGSSLFSVDGTGRIVPNQSLYNSNPGYKQAWDNLTQMNKQAGFDPNPFSSAQANQIVTQQMTDQLKAAGVDPTTITNPSVAASSGQFQPGTVTGGPTGGFAGSSGTVDPTAALRATPGYQWALSQGLEGVENSAAARGMQLSGATLKDLNNYAQGSADQTYQSQVGNLMQLAGLGGSSAGSAAGINASTGANIGNTITGAGQSIGSNIIGAGNAQAAGQVGSANAISGGLNSAGQMYTLSNLFGNNGGGSSWGTGIANMTSDPIASMNTINGWT